MDRQQCLRDGVVETDRVVTALPSGRAGDGRTVVAFRDAMRLLAIYFNRSYREVGAGLT